MAVLRCCYSVLAAISILAHACRPAHIIGLRFKQQYSPEFDNLSTMADYEEGGHTLISAGSSLPSTSTSPFSSNECVRI